jgi:hypothetical protein
MKKIVKIQSISDIITNSSSEVFIMEHSLARSLENDYNTDCISVDDITYEKMLEDNWNYEIYTEMLVKLGIVTWAECNYNSSWRAYTENREKFINIVTAHEAEISKALTENQYAFVDIEDHFTQWEDASDDAHSYCIAYESRH